MEKKKESGKDITNNNISNCFEDVFGDNMLSVSEMLVIAKRIKLVDWVECAEDYQYNFLGHFNFS